MDPFWKPVVWQQFGAAIDMLENAIRACPDDLWSDPSKKPEWIERNVAGFWYVVFHALFYLDYYLSDPREAFAPPAPYTLDEFDSVGVLPDRAYTKDEMLLYLEHGRQKCRAKIVGMTEEQARQPCGFERREFGGAELLLYVMRHVQHHAGQLNLLLRQNVNAAPRWVGTAALPLER